MRLENMEEIINMFGLSSAQAVDLLQRVLTSEHLMLAIIGDKGEIRYLNKGIAKMFGFPREELVGGDFAPRFRNTEEIARLSKTALAKGVAHGHDIGVLQATGHDRMVGLLFFSVFVEQDKSQMMLVVAHEMRGWQPKYDKETNLDFFSALISSMPEVIFVFDEKEKLRFVSESVTQLLGYSPIDLIGKPFTDLMAGEKEQRSVTLKKIKSALNTDEIYRSRLGFRHENGSTIEAGFTAIPHQGMKNRQRGVTGCIRDISSELVAEEELTLRNRHLATLNRISFLVAEGGKTQTLLEKILLIMMQTLDLRATMLYMISKDSLSGSLTAHRGVPRPLINRFGSIPLTQEWVDQIIEPSMPTRLLDIPAIDSSVKESMQKYHLEDAQVMPIQNKGRLVGLVAFSAVHGLTDEGQALLEAMTVHLGVAIENGRLLEEIRQNQAKYSAVVERANDGIMISQDGVFQFVNKKLADMLGYTVSEMIGMEITKTMSSEDTPEILDHYQRRITGEVPKEIYQGRLKTKKSGSVQVEFNAISTEYEGKTASLSFVRDMTERVRLQEQMLVEKETAEFFNDLLAHDVNNLMQTILGSIDLLSDETTAQWGKDQKKYVDMIQRTARHCTDLIDQVRELMMIRRLKPDAFVPLELKTIIREAADIIRDQFRDDDFDLEMKVGENQFVFGNELVKQIFVNTLSNAIRHNSKQEKWVGVEVAEDESGKMWCVSIEDNGDGIPEEAKSKLYKRFSRFSKKEGIGLGMSIVKALVDVMSGRVEVEDRVRDDKQQGTRIIVSLPKA